MLSVSQPHSKQHMQLFGDKKRASAPQTPTWFARGASPVSSPSLRGSSPVNILSMPLLTPVAPTIGSIPLASKTPRSLPHNTTSLSSVRGGREGRRSTARSNTAKALCIQAEQPSLHNRSDGLFFTGELGPSREVVGEPCTDSPVSALVAPYACTDRSNKASPCNAVTRMLL
jgi:hypothetical protein